MSTRLLWLLQVSNKRSEGYIIKEAKDIYKFHKNNITLYLRVRQGSKNYSKYKRPYV